VFSPPSRLCLDATHYDQVRQYGVSRQAFGILPKIRAVDQLLTPTLQASVREAHPELAWYALQGQPMRHNKKTRAGQEERLRALAPVLGAPLHGPDAPLSQALATFRRRDVAVDDLLDAFVLAWTAHLIATAQARCLPAQPPCDRRGLRMEICYGTYPFQNAQPLQRHA
jgi:predicted RNase H-like nuclease